MDAGGGIEDVIIFFLHHSTNFLTSPTYLFTVESALDFNKILMKAFLFYLRCVGSDCQNLVEKNNLHIKKENIFPELEPSTFLLGSES